MFSIGSGSYHKAGKKYLYPGDMLCPKCGKQLSLKYITQNIKRGQVECPRCGKKVTV